MLFPGSRSDLKLLRIIATKALKNIDRGKELYVSYCSEYTFPNVTFNTESQ